MIRAPLGAQLRYWYTYRTAVAVGIALVLTGIAYFLFTQQTACDTHAGACLVNIAVHPQDRLLANQVDPGSDVVIVGIDNQSVKTLGAYPVPRDVYATALQTLEGDGAGVVGFDVAFPDARDPRTDRPFADALATSTIPVVLAYPASTLCPQEPGCAPPDGKIVQTGLDQIPLKMFRCRDSSTDATTPCAQPDPNVALGSVDLVLDGDGVVRRVPLLVQPACYASGACSTPLIDSFGLAVYRAATLGPGFQAGPDVTESAGTARFGGAWTVPVDATGSALINFSGPPGNYVRFGHYLHFSDVVSGAVPASAIKGKIVLVGAYNLSGVNDEQLVTTSAGTNGALSMAGVEIHANVVRMLLGAPSLPSGPRSTLLAPEPGWLVVLLVLLLGLATAIGVSRVSVLWGLAGTVVALVGFTFAMAVFAESFGFVPDLFHPWLAIALTYTGVTAYRFLYEDREKRKVTSLFGQFLKPEIVNELAKTRRGVDDILRGGERRDITLLFVDIRGFTSMSESMEPHDVTELVTTYLDHLSGLIFKWDGTVDKYVGDEIMAFWNAPRLQGNHALLALRCAYDLVNHAPELEQKLLAKGLPPIRWGIGINSGPAVVGNMGSRSRIQYTALGDTVNTAARFCAHAPAFQVLIGQRTYEMCHEYVAVDLVPGVQLKGKSAETFRIYQVTAIRETPASAWVPFPTQMATQAHQTFTSQYTQQTVIAAGDSGSRDILVGEAAQEALSRQAQNLN